MDTAYVVTCTAPYPGRETKTLQFLVEANEYWEKQAADGKCTAPEMYVRSDGSTLWMVKGDRSVLGPLVEEDLPRLLCQKGALLLQDWRAELADTGPRMDTFMADYASALAALDLL